MITVKDKTQCCGCFACANICPSSSIQMKIDEEGFLYPEVLIDSCIDCGLCEKVCPMIHKARTDQSNSSVHFAVQYNNLSVRMESTAGGAFSLIAEAIIEQGGIVYGADYDQMVVVHKTAYKVEELIGMRGSKYVQSRIGEVYSKIGEQLKKNKIVLFTGTPCQVHGLINCVGYNENLYTMDLLCLGVSSPGLFHSWVEWLEDKYQCNVSRIYFRNKKFGYATSNVRIMFTNGKKLEQKYDSKCHPNTFFKAYNVRPSCYICKFREVPRVSDFTIGDFIQIGNYSKKMDDDKGTTSLWIHTQKGKKLFGNLIGKTLCIGIEKDCSKIIGGPASQMVRPSKRGDFFSDACQMSYGDFINKWMPKNAKSGIASIARIVLNHLPFNKVIFKAVRSYKSKKFHEQVKIANEKERQLE